jgi:hypothetical protein
VYHAQILIEKTREEKLTSSPKLDDAKSMFLVTWLKIFPQHFCKKKNIRRERERKEGDN